MAKKKAKTAAESAPKKSGAKKMDVPNAITIRGTPEWIEWLRRFSAKIRSKPTPTIDRALAELAEKLGFEEPPPRMGA